jgi:coproporphyrinogen III oxidase-like Fe-S oxidoreductase
VPTSIQTQMITKMNLPYNQNAGLYIHIPFCVRKCPYCDFYSVTDLALKPRFLKALAAEIELASAKGLCFDTLYIGGGTPSVYGYHDIGQIVSAVVRNFEFQPDSEITIEVNPGTVSTEQLKGCSHFTRKISIFWDAFIAPMRPATQSPSHSGRGLKMSGLI